MLTYLGEDEFDQIMFKFWFIKYVKDIINLGYKVTGNIDLSAEQALREGGTYTCLDEYLGTSLGPTGFCQMNQDSEEILIDIGAGIPKYGDNNYAEGFFMKIDNDNIKSIIKSKAYLKKNYIEMWEKELDTISFDLFEEAISYDDFENSRPQLIHIDTEGKEAIYLVFPGSLFTYLEFLDWYISLLYKLNNFL